MYTLETGNDEYIIVAYCSTVPYLSSYVFHSLPSTARQGWRTFELQPACTMICHAGPERLWVWDPTLGLINDVRAHRWPFLAAALSQAWVLRFVYLVFPIRLYNDHKYSSPPKFESIARRVATFRSLTQHFDLYEPIFQNQWNEIFYPKDIGQTLNGPLKSWKIAQSTPFSTLHLILKLGGSYDRLFL